MSPRRVVVVLALALIAAVVLIVRGGSGSELPDRPRDVVWDREACAFCAMHVGEPRSSAQLVTTAGEVVVFDDPACALRYIAAQRPSIHRLWFHGAGNTWIAAEDAGFVASPATPMGSGLAAVPRATAGARSLAEVAADLGLPDLPVPGARPEAR